MTRMNWGPPPWEYVSVASVAALRHHVHHRINLECTKHLQRTANTIHPS